MQHIATNRDRSKAPTFRYGMLRAKIAELQHLPAQEIADRLGITLFHAQSELWCIRYPDRQRARLKDAAMHRSARTGFASEHYCRWSAADDAFMREHYGSETMDAVMIARELGRSYKAVYERARRLGLRGQP